MHAFSQGDRRVFDDRQASPRVNGDGQDDQGNQPTLVDNGALPYSSTSTIRSPSENISQVEENNAQPLSKRPRLLYPTAVAGAACQCEHLQKVVESLKHEIRRQQEQYECGITFWKDSHHRVFYDENFGA